MGLLLPEQLKLIKQIRVKKNVVILYSVHPIFSNVSHLNGKPLQAPGKTEIESVVQNTCEQLWIQD